MCLLCSCTFFDTNVPRAAQAYHSRPTQRICQETDPTFGRLWKLRIILNSEDQVRKGGEVAFAWHYCLKCCFDFSLGVCLQKQWRKIVPDVPENLSVVVGPAHYRRRLNLGLTASFFQTLVKCILRSFSHVFPPGQFCGDSRNSNLNCTLKPRKNNQNSRKIEKRFIINLHVLNRLQGRAGVIWVR